ncbi:UNVERIFIED_CONTAM: hypothetical protein FKN15_073630 [Acipenser sinensis]
MGIPGLLQFINEASESVNVKKYKGQTVAVDTYCWLHKGAFSCAEKLAKGEPTDQRRQMNLQKGKQLLREGKLSEARERFTRCINVARARGVDCVVAPYEADSQLAFLNKSGIAQVVITEDSDLLAFGCKKVARARGVDCVVAPYEADSQLAFLNKSGIAQVVITEDSDLLAFGCKKVLLKMDKFGNGLEIDQACLGKCKQLGDMFTEEKFRYMCILSGCDYLASISGIGLAKACKLLKMANNPDIIKVIKKTGQYLKMNVTVPDEYIEGFTRANNTFLYQLVFDPISRRLVPLNPYPDDMDPKTLSYAGQYPLKCNLCGYFSINILYNFSSKNPSFAVQLNIYLQPVKTKSRGWNDWSAPRELSIWSRGYLPTGSLLKSFQSQSKMEASPEKPSTTGQAKVISTKRLKLPSREKLAKRTREENGISEKDLLSQYSFSCMKRFKKEEAEVPLSTKSPGQGTGSMTGTSSPVESVSPSAGKPGSQPMVRNRFATLLQRRNQEEGATGVPGTQSRFFSNSSSSGGSAVKQESAVKSEDLLVPEKGNSSQSNETPDLLTLIDTDNKEEESRTPAVSSLIPQSSPSPSPSGRGTGVFGWSGSLAVKAEARSFSGISSLQQFHRMKDSSPYWGKPHTEPSALLNKLSEEDCPCQEAEESDNDDHPRSERGSSPQSQGTGYPSRDSLSSSGVPRFSQTSQRKMDFIVSGLLRVSPAGSGKTSKIKLSGPAKASGLSKRSSQKKKVGVSDENQPALQVTIRDLWKNFGFKK